MSANKKWIIVVALLLVVGIAVTALTLNKNKGGTDKNKPEEIYTGVDITDGIVTDAEKLFTLDNILQAINSNEYITGEFNIAETSADTIELDSETDKYNYTRKIRIFGAEKDIPTDTEGVRSIAIEICTYNGKAAYLGFDVYEDNNPDAIGRTEEAIKEILNAVVGEKITEEIATQDNGTMIEHTTASEKGFVTTMKNVVAIDELEQVGIEYYVDIAGSQVEPVELSDFVFKNENQKVFNWIPEFENDITSDKFANDFAKLYNDEAKFKVTRVETDDNSFTVNTKFDLQTIVGESVFKSSFSLIGMELVDTVNNEQETKLQKTISVSINLPSYETEEEAVLKAKEFADKLFKTEIVLDPDVDIATESAVNFTGENSPLIEVSKLTGIIQKTLTANGRCAVSIEATLEDNTLINGYVNYLEEIMNGADIDELFGQDKISDEELAERIKELD